MGCNYFSMTDQTDSFETWAGLRGPQGVQGEPGTDGKNLELHGPVATTGDLPSSADSSEIWLVGSSSPYDGYFYDGARWVPLGPILSGPGVPAGGTAGQILQKNSSTNYDSVWRNPSNLNPRMNGTAAPGTSTFLSRSDHVHPHDDLIVRENMLDNGYFVRTASSFGNGVFPINSRGRNPYTASSGVGYCYDRWYYSRGSLTSYTAGVRMIWDGVNGSMAYMGQHIKSPEALIGKTVTASALVNNELLSLTWEVVAESAPSSVVKPIEGYNFTLAMSYSTSGNNKPRVVLQTVDTEGRQMIKAVKLEIGDTQTLAHLEGSTWVLNEVPHWEDQLLRCSTAQVDDDDSYANRAVAFTEQIPTVTTQVGTVTWQSGDNKTLDQYGILTSYGQYFINICTQDSNHGVASVYYVRYTSSGYTVDAIYEGTWGTAPRISSSGVLSPNSASGSSYTFHYAAQKV